MHHPRAQFDLHGQLDWSAPWALTLASGDRREAYETADDVRADHRGAAVRLGGELHDPNPDEFNLLTPVGDRKPRRSPGRRAAVALPSCACPQDLATAPARAEIGRVLSGWLRRNGVTAFELLHRADLAERLAACQGELSGAIYHAALAEAAAQDAELEVVRRRLEALARAATERLAGEDPDLAHRLGVAVAGRLAGCAGFGAKLEVLLDMLDAAPQTGGAAALAHRVMQQPLIDIFDGQAELAEVFGGATPLGDRLLILLQLASAPVLAALGGEGADWMRTAPRPQGLAQRLAMALHARTSYAPARRAIARRVVSELAGEARLWPDDPAREVAGVGEIFALLEIGRRAVDHDRVSSALARRWRRMAGPSFVDARLSQCRGAIEEVEVMIELIGLAIGRAAVDALGRRLLALIDEGGFEQEIRFNPDPLAANLRRLARIAARLKDAPLRPETRGQAAGRLKRLAAVLRHDAAAIIG